MMNTKTIYVLTFTILMVWLYHHKLPVGHVTVGPIRETGAQ